MTLAHALDVLCRYAVVLFFVCFCLVLYGVCMAFIFFFWGGGHPVKPDMALFAVALAHAFSILCQLFVRVFFSLDWFSHGFVWGGRGERVRYSRWGGGGSTR